MEKKLSYNVISKYRGILMGIAIISILFFHYTDDCRIYNYNFSGFLKGFNQYISSSSVDAFLFISGFGLYYAFKKNNDPVYFFKRRVSRIIVPYAILAIPAWFWKDIIYLKLGFVQFFKDLFFITFFEKNVTWFWYILMSIMCYLIFPYIFEIVETAQDKITEQMRMIVMFMFFTMVAVLLQLYYDRFFGNVNIALLRFPAFVAGCFIGKASYKNREIPYGWGAVLLLSVLMLYLRTCNRVIIVRYVLGFFNINLCILLAVVFAVLSNKEIHCPLGKKVVEWFGSYSLELYLTHVMVRAIMNWLGYHTCYVKYEIIMLVFTVILSLILKHLTNLTMKLLK